MVVDTNTSGPGSGAADGGETKPNYAAKARERIASEAGNLRDQATGKARDYARQGKDKTTGTLHDIARALDESAGSVDTRLGNEYGEYAHMAANAVADFASKLEAKDVDELMHDAENMVRKSPAVAIGLAAVAGFAIARLFKSGMDELRQDERGDTSGAAASGTVAATGTGDDSAA